MEVCEATILKTGDYCGETAKHVVWHKIVRTSKWFLCCRHFDSHYRIESHQHHVDADRGGRASGS